MGSVAFFFLRRSERVRSAPTSETQRATESLSADRKFWLRRLEDVKLMQMGDSERRGACRCLVSESLASLFPRVSEKMPPEVALEW